MARLQVVMPIKTLLSREKNQKYLVEALKSLQLPHLLKLNAQIKWNSRLIPS